MAKKTASLPTRDDLLGLPFWALVAFGARVGRRLLPLVEHCWETKIADDVKYLAKTGRVRAPRSCVRQTEQVASKAAVLSEQKLYDTMGVVYVAAGQAEYAAQLAQRKPGSIQYAASHAGSVIHVAAQLAFRRLKPDWNCEPGLIIYFVGEVGKVFGAAAVNAAVRADFDRLRGLIDEKGWTDDTPVRPSAFGPLWPDGLPKGWPQG